MKKRKAARSSSTLWWVAGAALVVVVGLVAISQMGGKQAGTPVSVQSDAELHAAKNVIGSPSAKLQLVEYGDYL